MKYSLLSLKPLLSLAVIRIQPRSLVERLKTLPVKLIDIHHNTHKYYVLFIFHKNGEDLNSTEKFVSDIEIYIYGTKQKWQKKLCSSRIWSPSTTTQRERSLSMSLSDQSGRYYHRGKIPGFLFLFFMCRFQDWKLSGLVGKINPTLICLYLSYHGYHPLLLLLKL